MGKYLKLFANHSAYSQAESSLDKPNVALCQQEGDVHYNPIPIIDGHKYIDLGLPSGTKWATMNVGANSETDYGLYFAWGETQGYADASTKAFSWNDYRWTEDGGSTMTKYNSTDKKTVLDPEDDAARANWGRQWHMPTNEQCFELFKETKSGFVTNTGVFTQYAWDDTDASLNPTETTANIDWDTAGQLFFKNTYASVTDAISAKDYLFIPAAGGYEDSEVGDVGNYGYVWASDRDAQGVEGAWNFSFSSDRASVYDSGGRCGGFSVRAVVG